MAATDLTETPTGRRPDLHDLGFAVAAIAAFIALLALGAGMTFFGDEWAFIESRSLADPLSWLPPHNEHWSTVPIVVYRALVESVGLATYVPYLVVLLCLHVLIAWLVYELVRRTSGVWPALACGIAVLLLGSGFENLFWGFQIGFLTSIAAGLAALLLMEGPTSRRRVGGAILSILISLASSGIGLVFAAVVAVDLAVDPRRRPLLAALNIPAAAYAAWYLIFGRFGLAGDRNPLTLEAMAAVPPFVVAGVQGSLVAVTGISAVPQALLIALVAATAWSLSGRGPRIPGRFIACIAGVITMYALIGLVRAHIFATVVLYTRYTYVAAVLLLIAVAAFVGRVRRPARLPQRLIVVGGSAAIFATSMAWNVHLLVAGRQLFLDRADWTRALIVATTDPMRPGNVDPDGTMQATISRYGSPLDDRLVPWAVRAIPEDRLARARRQLASGEVLPPGAP